MKLNSVRKCLIIITLVSISWFVRLLPYAKGSPVRGGFYANGLYAVVYTVNSGQLLSQEAVNSGSIVGRGVLNGAQDVLISSFLSIFINVLSDSTSPVEIAYIINSLPWQGLVFLPISMLVFAKSFKRYTELPSIYIILFSLFGVYQFIYLGNTGLSNAVVAWSNILLILLLLKKIYSSMDSRFLLLLTIIYVSTLGWYHTAAIVVFVFVSFYTTVSTILPSKSQKLSIYILSVSTILYLSYNMYVSQKYFSYFVSNGLLVAVPSILSGSLFSPSSQGVDVAYRDPIILSGILKYMALIPRVIFVIGCSIFAYLLISTLRENGLRRLGENMTQYIILYYGLAMSVILILISTTQGILVSLVRTFQYSVITFPAISFQSVNICGDNLCKRAFVLLLIISSLSAPYVYLNTNTHQTEIVSTSEYASVSWISEYSENKSAGVFTDYRLSSPLKTNGHFEVSSVWLSDLNRTEILLEQIYYSTNGKKAVQSIAEDEPGGISAEYLLVSQRYQESSVGIRVSGFKFKPLSVVELEKFDNTYSANKIHDSGDGHLYVLA